MADQTMQESIYEYPSFISAAEYNLVNTPLFLPDDFISMEYDAGFSDSVGIGRVSSACVKLKISGTKNFLNKKIRVDVTTPSGSNGAYRSETIGWFTVVENQQDGSSTTITAYDGAYLLNRAYIPTIQKDAAGYSTAKIMGDILRQCTDAEKYKGATLQDAIGGGMYVNYIDREITGFTCAEMIGFIASLSGDNARIDQNGKLRFVSMAEMPIYLPGGLRKLTKDYVYEDSLKIGGLWQPAGIVCEADEEETLYSPIHENGAFQLYLRNPFMTQSMLNTAASRLAACGSYVVGQCAHFGGGFVRPCDVVPVQASDGTDHLMIASGVHIEFDGGVRTEFSSAFLADDSEMGSGGNAGVSSGDLVSQVNQLEQAVSELENGPLPWKELTLSSGVSAYSTNFGGSTLGEPSYCVKGGVCRLAGSVQAAYSGSAVTLASLPEKAWPTGNVYRLTPCGGKRIARIYVNTVGELKLEWLLNLSDGSNYTTSTWVQINLEYPVHETGVFAMGIEQEEDDQL